jgi:hypothetical protein
VDCEETHPTALTSRVSAFDFRSFLEQNIKPQEYYPKRQQHKTNLEQSKISS